MRVLDLFSGIGGFSLGLERAGMRTVAFCERDEFCRAVLRKHWPDVPCFHDVRTLDADRLGGLGPIDLICGGFPCQPFSSAGKQRAQTDDRYLWPAMREVIALARPTWVIGENVTGIIALALDDVLADLENDGYTPRALVIPACAVDARHRRDRVWILAHRNGGGFSEQSERNGRSARGKDGSCGSYAERLCDAMADAQDVADSECIGRESMVKSVSYRPDCERPATAITDSGISARRGRWDAEPNVGRVAHGVPARVDRLKTLGNAVVPQVIEEIGRAIMSQQLPGTSSTEPAK